MLHLVGQLLIQISDARNHKHKKTAKSVYPIGIKQQFLGCTAHNVITALITLPRLQNNALEHDK